ncbi:MAG: hypothetical protein AB8F94_04960 [Saprospiraceae bacterium]
MNFLPIFFILILIFLVYFFSKKVLEICKIGSNVSQRNSSILLGVFLSPFLYGGISGGKLMVEEYYLRTEFNQEIWMTKINERFKMSNHIIDSKMLIGKSEGDLITLLGKDFFKENSNHLAYRIGFIQKIFTKEPFILNVCFKNEKVNFVTQDINVMYW